MLDANPPGPKDLDVRQSTAFELFMPPGHEGVGEADGVLRDPSP